MAESTARLGNLHLIVLVAFETIAGLTTQQFENNATGSEGP